MEEQKLTLRIKSRKSQNGILKDVSTKQTVEEFLKRISPMTGVPEDRMTLLTGFPPKRIPYERLALLETLGLSNQDTLIVEVDKEEASAGNLPVIPTITPSVKLWEIPNAEFTLAAKKPNLKGGNSSDQNKAAVSTKRTIPVNSSGQSSSKSNSAIDSSPASGSIKNQLIINALNSSTMRELDSKPTEEVATGTTPSVPQNSPGSTTLNHSEPNIFEAPDDLVGMMLRQVVPSDNSCLFTSVSYCLSGTMDENELAGASHMRELIAATVESDPTQFNEAMLGRPNPEYVTWIMKSESWGGGIELSILSDFYGVEISVVDIQSLHISRFGEDKNYTQRMLLLYDGIHYDPLYLEPFDGSKIQTLFPTSDESILEKAMQLGKEAKTAHQFTDLSHFALRCGICNTLIRGQIEAQAHAKQTGHTDFSETMSK